MLRNDGREPTHIRSVSVLMNPFGYSDASVLFSLGQTKILACISLQAGVPPFLRGKGAGWLAAEYCMLPSSTKQRTSRDGIHKNGRSVELSRLIGRSLRSNIKLEVLGERTIVVDCDVLQADGSTRVAAITAASIALSKAQEVWLSRKIIKEPFIKNISIAVSVGILDTEGFLLDVNQSEDNVCSADLTIVGTHTLDIIEVQGTGEKNPIPLKTFCKAIEFGALGLEQMYSLVAPFFIIPPPQSTHSPLPFCLEKRGIFDNFL